MLLLWIKPQILNMAYRAVWNPAPLIVTAFILCHSPHAPPTLGTLEP